MEITADQKEQKGWSRICQKTTPKAAGIIFCGLTFWKTWISYTSGIKQTYRKYNIKTVEGADDYASMREVVKRRYLRAIEEESPLPDLIITDGGKGQMSAVKQALEEMSNQMM